MMPGLNFKNLWALKNKKCKRELAVTNKQVN